MNSIFCYFIYLRDLADKKIHVFAAKKLHFLQRMLLSRFGDLFFLRIYYFIKPLELLLSYIISSYIVIYGLMNIIEIFSEYIHPLKAIYNSGEGTRLQIIFVITLILTICVRLLMYIFIDIPISIEGKERRNTEAKTILLNIKKGHPEKFVFYIRRFFSDSGLDFELYQDNLLGLPQFWRRPIDYFFWKAGPSKRPFIQIGSKNTHDSLSAGALHFLQNEEGIFEKQKWFVAFTELSLAAEKIIAVPLTTKSSDSHYREIKWIKDNDLLYKTVFIMPPKCKVYFSEEGNEKHKSTIKIKGIWDESCKTLKEILNLNLPEYSSKGGYIIFPKKGTVLFFQHIAGRNWKSKSIIKAILKGETIPSRLRFSIIFAIDQFKSLLIIMLLYTGFISFNFNKKELVKFELDTGIYLLSTNVLLLVVLSLMLPHIYRAFGMLKGFGASILFLFAYGFILKSPRLIKQFPVVDYSFVITMLFAVSMLIGYIFFDDRKYYVPQEEK